MMSADGTLNRPIPILRLGLAVICLATLAGCMVGPNYKRPETKVPEKWDGQKAVTPAQPSKTTPNPVALVDWWNAFNDPTLSSLVEMAIRSNLDLRLAEARIRQARAAQGVAGAPLWPEVDLNAQYQRSWPAGQSLTSPGISPTPSPSPTPGKKPTPPPSTTTTTLGGIRDFFRVGLDSTWELDIFGGTRRNIEATGADLQAALEDRRDVLITLVGDVGNNYISLRGFQQQIDIARRNLKAQRHTAEITRKRYEAGFVSALEVAQADAQVATTEAVIPVFESSARAAIYSLGVLLGREPAALTKELAIESPIPPTPPEIPVGLPSELVRRRPDIRRAEAQLHAATARIGVATADLFPKFSLTGSLGFSANDLAKLGSFDSKFWSFGPSVTWPIFAGGRIYWNIKVQDALTEQALAAYEKAILTALKDVETALVAYAKEQEHRKSLAEAVVNNRRAVELSLKLYLVGKTDFLNVLTAQRSLFTSEDALSQSVRTVDTNLIALYKALGGGWEKSP